MDNSSDWLLQLLQHYKIEKQRSPQFISDWDAIHPLAKYPHNLIKEALALPTKDTLKYLFADEVSDLKELILKCIDLNLPHITKSHMAITLSGTASIFLSLSVLYKKGARNFLLFTPTYYTIADTINDLGGNVFYYNLQDYKNFCVDKNEIQRLVESHKIDVIVFSDPIYSAGIEMAIDVYEFLSSICKTNNCWILCDYTLGGMEWNSETNSMFNNDKLKILSNTDHFIFIESITKRLLINGLKSSLIFCSTTISPEIEDLASQVYGGFCIPQIELVQQLYKKENRSDILSIIEHNKQIIMNNYDLLLSFLINTPYTIYKANSGYFTMIVHRELRINEVSSKAIITNYLFQHDLLAFPSFHFSFNENNHFGFRVNLLSKISHMLPLLGKCIREDIKLLH